VALEARKVRFFFGRRAVLDGLDLSLADGEMAAVLGPNGVGKSTLLRLLSGSLAPQSGEVLLDGEPLARVDARTRALKMAAVFPGIHREAAFTVRQMVGMGRAPHMPFWGRESAEDRMKIRQALEAAGLVELQDQLIGELSSGELQRSLIAMALAQDAPTILLDEPTAFLDLKHQVDLLSLLVRLNRELGKTILCVTHDLNLAARFFGRLFLMKSGKIAYQGAPFDVLTPEKVREVFGVDVEIRRDAKGGIGVDLRME